MKWLQSKKEKTSHKRARGLNYIADTMTHMPFWYTIIRENNKNISTMLWNMDEFLFVHTCVRA